MGHAGCGGVNAMVHGAPANCQDFVAPWVQQGAPVVRRVAEACAPDEVEQMTEEAVVRLSLENLRTFPWITEREAAKPRPPPPLARSHSEPPPPPRG